MKKMLLALSACFLFISHTFTQNATHWNGYSNEFNTGIQVTGDFNAIPMFASNGSYYNVSAGRVKSFLETASGNWNIHAASATNTTYWGNIGADFANGPGGSNLAWIAAADGTAGTVRPYFAPAIRTWLGIPSGGETLQSVTDRGAQTNKPLFITGEASSVPDAPSLVLYYRPSTGTANIAGYDYQNSVPKHLIFQEAGGNVGIGTTSPTHKLDVAGVVRSYNAAFGSANWETSPKGFVNFGANNHGSVIVSSNLYISGSEDLKVANTHATMPGAAIVIPGNSRPNQNGILFYTKPPSPAIDGDDYNTPPRMIISSSGNVGIGTIDPQSELAVKGTITSKKVKVTQEGWADYVFDSSYQLTPLHHVEKYIQANKHLPEVPSAAEVRKDGLDLGDNQAILLKKIEELTLYIIEQNKELKLLAKKVEKLEADK
jgi:hypothetical protein